MIERPPIRDVVDPRVKPEAVGAAILGDLVMRTMREHMRARACPIDFGPAWLRVRMTRALNSRRR